MIPAKMKTAISRVFMLVPAIETFSIFSQDSGFGLLGNILAAANRLRDVGKHPVPMGIVRSEKNLIIADALDHIWKRFLFGLSGEEPISEFDIIARFIFTQGCFHFTSFLPFLIDPFHPVGNPANAAFKKAYPQFGKFLRDAAVHQAGKLNKSFHGAANGVHKNETIETLFTGWSPAPVMHAERHVETLHLFIERPKGFRSQVLFHALTCDGNGA